MVGRGIAIVGSGQAGLLAAHGAARACRACACVRTRAWPRPWGRCRAEGPRRVSLGLSGWRESARDDDGVYDDLFPGGRSAAAEPSLDERSGGGGWPGHPWESAWAANIEISNPEAMTAAGKLRLISQYGSSGSPDRRDSGSRTRCSRTSSIRAGSRMHLSIKLLRASYPGSRGAGRFGTAPYGAPRGQFRRLLGAGRRMW